MSSARSRKSRSSSRRSQSSRTRRRPVQLGQHASAGGWELQSYEVGALPLVNAFLDRMRLSEIIAEHLPADDPRTELPTPQALMVLVRNVLLSRQPVYGVSEWAARFAPDLLDLWPDEIAQLHDDRLGRSLHRLFLGVGPQLIMAVVRHVVQEFSVSLDELHNDSTTVSFYGAYEDAQQVGSEQGRPTHAITWGHNKDHRPDLKQLLYILTVSEDGGVPVYFSSASGNVADDRTHCGTWDLLRELVGRPDFLYVADCKLASSENLKHIATRGGRFVTVMPRTYKEDQVFRDRLRKASPRVIWRPLYDIKNEQGDLCDRFCVCTDEMITSDGYRLFWFHSRRKADLDAVARNRRVQRALALLADLQTRLIGPRTRYRQRAKVEQAVVRILEDQEVKSFVVVHIAERCEETYRQAGPGRPTKKTRYVKATKPGYTLSWELDNVQLTEAERDDGVFPLLSNDRSFDAEQVLRAYKRQPLIEKRFSQMKTDFVVAPVYLQNVTRIQGLMAVYFFALMTQTLMERELRRAMLKADVPSLPLYPEGRPCTRPTMYRIFELFEPIQRHEMQPTIVNAETSNQEAINEQDAHVMVSTLTSAHREILKLLGMSATDYGR